MSHCRRWIDILRAFSSCCRGETAGAYVAGSSFFKRQSALVEAFADEMSYHVGDEKEMALCLKEYKGKIGPMLYRETMFKVGVCCFLKCDSPF